MRGRGAPIRIGRAPARKALKQAMGDFDHVEIAEPAVKLKSAETKAIRRAVRAFYRRDAIERT